MPQLMNKYYMMYVNHWCSNYEI